ncbi:MAG: hypothetical protein ACD_50C00322G0003 [uncultured bacterium]|nr:MAG: hypothetical protein ACD_50C00322G0003 [uncultured bacterium]KKQ96339.1 MAG: hypothetical protein UT20_C0012G0016 [Candidatus Levybacteria bacterium GW2011_GWA1_39_11]KKR24659.1 MAG: hypothetical protein UT56_C0011G0016 [Candidatus Levybacteria bacterium GW2011_GWB1_39_7]KKR49726.1 MAG: hypothetical protein UT85_C0012G0016 [Candidatus Levybacteria bacterium GW2011_GWA2_40_16]OGH15577.1 MAG: hypothetical protein A2689_01585 [Candidatus Levybacteria bacterium RIFCSPHIGHO2_01_FULL_38_96]O
MQTQRINITLPQDLAAELRRSIPDRSRSKFIANALREKLAKSNLAEQLSKSAEAQKEIIKEIQEDFKYADQEVINKLP